MFQSLSIIHFNLYPLSICRVSCGYCHSLYINSLFYLLIYFTLDVFISIFQFLPQAMEVPKSYHPCFIGNCLDQ